MAALFIYLVIFHLDEESLPTSLFPHSFLTLRFSLGGFVSASFPRHPPDPPSSLPYIKAVLFFRDQQVRGIKGVSGLGKGD